MDSLKQQLKSFVSKKISVGVAGIASAAALNDDKVLYLAAIYIIVQGLVDAIKAWKT